MIRKILIVALSSLFILTYAKDIPKDGIPEKPKVEHLVNDLANILTLEQRQQLEQKLVAYSNQTSTQVAVVTVKSLNGYERADFTIRLAEKWGIGSSKNDNGILLLVKPKYKNSKGQVHIATGYGLEGAATDLATGQIVRNLIIPHFKQNDYFGGIYIATDALIDLTKGEYNEASYPPQNSRNNSLQWFFILFFLGLFFFMSVIKTRSSKQYQMSKSGRSSIPFWLLLSLLAQGNGRGSFRDFNSGSGEFGSFGGGGGFSGFGGGSFGGGGAGGSW